MAKASPETIAQLEKTLNAVAADLNNVTAKKMFGCHALWTSGNIFALVWKEGRIGFKIPDQEAYTTLAGKKGADPWTIGPKQMSHWIFVPESLHTKQSQLKVWATQAHELCGADSSKKTAKKNKAAKSKKKG